jgi:hypothetical protein
VGGCGYAGGAPHSSWDADSCTLMLTYSADVTAAGVCQPSVTASFQVEASPLDGVATVATAASISSNAGCNKTLTELLWLSDVIVPHTTIADFFLPLLPGINLTRPFFAQKTPHMVCNIYPGRSWASDLVGWGVDGGARLAMMARRNASDPPTPTNNCLTGQSEDDWFWHHTYPCSIGPGHTYTTPVLLLALGHFDFQVGAGKSMMRGASFECAKVSFVQQTQQKSLFPTPRSPRP